MKSFAGHFFEDFRIGQVLVHATPRTVTAGIWPFMARSTGTGSRIPPPPRSRARSGSAIFPPPSGWPPHRLRQDGADVSLNAVANLATPTRDS